MTHDQRLTIDELTKGGAPEWLLKMALDNDGWVIARRDGDSLTFAVSEEELNDDWQEDDE